VTTQPTDLPGRSLFDETIPVSVAPSLPAVTLDPLYDASCDSSEWAPPLDLARRLARKTLEQYQGATIHDHKAMIEAAVALDYRLRGLLAALDAEDGAA